MAGAYGTPCSGELQFWAVVQSQLREQSKQLARIADLLAARNQAENIAFAPTDVPVVPAVDCAKLREALDELVANLEKASARDVFSIIDRKVLLDAKAALAATAAELGSAAKELVAFKVGDKVLWDDPDGEITRGWEVVNVPEPDDEGEIPEDGIYSIYRDETKSAAEAHGRELILDCPGGAR